MLLEEELWLLHLCILRALDTCCHSFIDKQDPWSHQKNLKGKMQKDQIFPNKLTLSTRKTSEYLWEYKNVQHNKIKSTISGTQLKVARFG